MLTLENYCSFSQGDNIYDNSIDDADACLLFRMTDGLLFKQYTDDIPEWAMPILK